MKKYVLLAFAVLPATALLAQSTAKKKPVAATKKPAAAPAASAPVLKNAADSFSYAIGLSIASFYKAQGISNINNTLVLKALSDSKVDKALLNEQQVNNCIVSYMQKANSEKASPNKKAGQEFLAENKKKPGVVSLPSGLQYQVVKEGTGPKPGIEDQVKVHYHGTLIDGTVFDSSVERGQPITLGLKNVIPGWTEALQLMPVGSKWKLFIPSDLAYGDNPAGPSIKAGSTLIFDVELIEIVKE
ncbi:peptidylprolyl isomerase [Niastella yeongjuensis]|uniref:Peptidyl-prolyl cis-trans isomerase n=1 Tax=Niastella yeongjuensis TaxID=354355 RepID=A0A1V9EA96_9BACT|nr:FKBP-type peptidyl-prolyl cis-trans isomerase [Niastella yeongjuensis]OQP43043.1 peptidylprolyl isomerase [Niastella yeongjuensis]SEO64268.1 FKBP-type peptidyl-prolyl cis-trans isomerase FklB [Niastella yeongjuensis]